MQERRYFSIVENKRVRDARVQQRHVLYLGKTSSSQEPAWRRSIEVLDDSAKESRTLSLLSPRLNR